MAGRTASEVRRVVTGVNAAGKSCVLSDGPVQGPKDHLSILWGTDAGAPQIPGTEDAAPKVTEIFGPDGSTRLIATTMAPDAERGEARLSAGVPGANVSTGDSDGWHTTESVDYIIIVHGEIVCELDEGEVILGPGDVLVQTGTRHRWRNRTSEPALFFGIPVGATRRA